MTPSILTRKAIVGSSEAGASSTARLNAEISLRIAGRELSVAFTGQIGIPSEVSALRSDLRSASRQISQASASPVASKTSVGVPLISSVKICDGPVNARFIVIHSHSWSIVLWSEYDGPGSLFKTPACSASLVDRGYR